MSDLSSPLHTGMTKAQAVFGIFFIPFHSVLLPMAFSSVYNNVMAPAGIILSTATLNLALYSMSFLILLFPMLSYLRKSFSAIFDHFGKFVTSVLMGVSAHYVLSFILSFLLLLVMPELANPNTDAIISSASNNTAQVLVYTVLLAPIIEETMFRGALFGAIRNKHRIIAYIVTAVVFSVYHLWSYFFVSYSNELWLYLLQYVPITVILCLAYEKSGTLWSPILIHAIINFISIRITAM